MRPANISHSLGLALLLTALSSGFLLGGCGGDAPTLSPISAQTVRVNEELTLEIGVDNPDGRAVTLRLEEVELPGFDRVHSISTSPSGARFRWSPLSSQTGTHELTFLLTDGGGGTEYDRATVIFTVMPSEDAAPVFVRPGAGGTYDLERDPCVTVDVEVRDDDSSMVEIDSRSELPERASLVSAGLKRATFDWCPTPDQVASSERWTIQLFADDMEHPRVEHDYIVVLRSGPKEGCPGGSPVVNVNTPGMGEAITSSTTYNVAITVTDDMGLRDPPLLYYTTTAPDDLSNPDVTQFMQTSFEIDSGDNYVARIPSLGLSEGEMTEVYFFASATDNDDPTGTACDHRTDSNVVSFFAVGGEPPDGTLANCELCAASTECESGICAAGAGGGRCVESCSGDGVCDEGGTCGATPTTEGGAPAGCGPTSEVCGGGTGMCTEDGREQDDTVAQANPYTSPITDGQICAMDSDYFGVTVANGERVTVTIDNFTHALGADLDLELRTSSGTILGTSASIQNMESVEYCNSESSRTLYARVFGFMSSENNYNLTADVVTDPGGCCTVDTNEEDDSQMEARSVTFLPAGGDERADFDGTWCNGDDDWIAIPMTGPGQIEVNLIFVDADADIDIALHDPSGTRIAGSTSVTDDETLIEDVGAAGTYALRVYGFGSGNDYLGEVIRRSGASCSTTDDCPRDTVCNAGSCVADICTSMSMCPAMHTCVETGPIPAALQCAANCSVNADCRSGEACKWTANGRGCGRTGTQAFGETCASFESCRAQRTCVSWPGGFCARQGCTSEADCASDPGTHCIGEGGINVCTNDCLAGFDADCRAGYECWPRTPVGGTGTVWGCIPAPG